MKVFVVIEWDTVDVINVRGVFSTREQAEALARTLGEEMAQGPLMRSKVWIRRGDWYSGNPRTKSYETWIEEADLDKPNEP